MAKQKISFWQFLFKISDDYMQFLRNFSPAVLFLSLSLFALPEIRLTRWNIDDVFLTLFACGAFFIAFSVIVLNILSFAKKILHKLQEIHHKERTHNEHWREVLKQLWNETNTKQILFFVVVVLIATLMVLSFGMNYAFNFYRTIATLAS